MPAAGDGIGAEVAHRVLEAARRALVVDAEHLAVEHEVAARETGHDAGDGPEAVGDLVQVACVDAHLPVVAVGLDAGPSSFHSTDAGPVAASAAATSGAGDASIGCTARPGTMPTAARASTPPVSAACAVRPRSPASMWARRTAAIGTPAAFATASTITPSSAPWRSSPPNIFHSRSCSGSVARAKTS